MTRREKDLAFMKDPYKWPNLVLPVKRGRECGIILDKPIVYVGNMWNLPKDLKAVLQHKYETFEAMVDDGWMVD